VAGPWYRRIQQRFIRYNLTLSHWSQWTLALFGHEGKLQNGEDLTPPSKKPQESDDQSLPPYRIFCRSNLHCPFYSSQRVSHPASPERSLGNHRFWGPSDLYPGLCSGGLSLCAGDPAHSSRGCTFRGFAYVWVGAMAGATASFWIGRTLGREFAVSLIGDRLRKYDDAIERNGFATVLYLRLVYFPFTPLNFGMGLTRIRFWDYFLGTGLGIIVGTFIFTFLVGALKEVWASGNWRQLISFNVFFSVGLFVFSFFVPKIIKKFKKEN
jgi:membrane protein DedA with SNARE-associated domain